MSTDPLTPEHEKEIRAALAEVAGTRLDRLGWPRHVRALLAEVERLRAERVPVGMSEADLARLVAEKNRLVRENNQLRCDVEGLAERVAAQSELLSKRAERQADGTDAGRLRAAHTLAMHEVGGLMAEAVVRHHILLQLEDALRNLLEGSRATHDVLVHMRRGELATDLAVLTASPWEQQPVVAQALAALRELAERRDG